MTAENSQNEVDHSIKCNPLNVHTRLVTLESSYETVKAMLTSISQRQEREFDKLSATQVRLYELLKGSDDGKIEGLVSKVFQLYDWKRTVNKVLWFLGTSLFGFILSVATLAIKDKWFNGQSAPQAAQHIAAIIPQKSPLVEVEK